MIQTIGKHTGTVLSIGTDILHLNASWFGKLVVDWSVDTMTHDIKRFVDCTRILSWLIHFDLFVAVDMLLKCVFVSCNLSLVCKLEAHMSLDRSPGKDDLLNYWLS